MRAATYYENGGPEVFRYEGVPDPQPGLDDVLIRVEAIGIQGGDVMNRREGELTNNPHVVGYQCAGVVLSVGGLVTAFKEGDRVVTTGVDGSHAELRSTGQSFCWLIPEGLSMEEAACVPIEFGTAHDCLFEFGRLKAGETVSSMPRLAALESQHCSSPSEQAHESSLPHRATSAWNGFTNSGWMTGSTTRPAASLRHFER